MLTKTQEQILVYLLGNQEQQLTIRGLAKKLGKSYTLVYNNLTKLEKSKIIKKQSVPPTKIVTLNEFAPADLLVGLELKRKKEFMDKFPWIQIMLDDILDGIKSPFFTLIVFGSYAKKTHTKKSDLDLLVIVENKKSIKEIENAIQNTYTKVKKGLNFVDIDEFKEMIQNPQKFNIGNEARKHHIILHGAEAYYQILNQVNKT